MKAIHSIVRDVNWTRLTAVVIIGIIVCGVTAYQVDATTATAIVKFKSASLKGTVTDSHERVIAGATVYFIDASTLDLTPITPANITDGSAETRDEPLEDILFNPANSANLKNMLASKQVLVAKTNSKGLFSVQKLNANAQYFAFTVPPDASASTTSSKGSSKVTTTVPLPAIPINSSYLPGGDASRTAFSPKALRKSGLHIQLSWQVPADATYIGTTACYVCHGPGSKSDISSNKHHGHSLMFHKPGVVGDTANQDSAGHQGASWNELANRFTPATAFNMPVAPATTVETLYVTDFNSNSATNNGQTFAVYENHASTRIDPATGHPFVTHLKYYLWTNSVTSNGNYYITIENAINPADPNNFVTLQVPFFMGGYIRQKAFVTLPGLKGAYGSPVNFYALPGSASQGAESNFDRSRRPFVDSLFGSASSFYDPKTKKLKVSATTNTVASIAGSNNSSPTNSSCASCHLGFGSYTSFTDATTGETLAHTVNDPNGIFDLGGDGNAQDVGINCEQCHGPGSSHRTANLNAIIAPPVPVPARGSKKAAPDTTGKFIVNPKLLGTDRASLICGRCHDPRGILANESGNFPAVGISRAEYIANFVTPTQKSFSASQVWADQLHGTGGHHGMTYENYLCSVHARNSTRMVACDDCHDSMGNSNYRYSLKGDPDDSGPQGLCNTCHNMDISAHVLAQTGSVMKGGQMNCINCHMTRTGKGGAGQAGLLLGTPTGLTSDGNIIYWQGDQSSHVFDVPHKFSRGVAGVAPSSAMPIPYTNACGTCHDASKLQFQQPQ